MKEDERKHQCNATIHDVTMQAPYYNQIYEQNACKGKKQGPKKLKFFIRIYTVQDVKKLNFLNSSPLVEFKFKNVVFINCDGLSI